MDSCLTPTTISENLRLNVSTELEEVSYFTTGFDDLPYEIRIKAFSYLGQSELGTVAKVSKSWRTLAYDPILWKRITLISEEIGDVDCFLNVLQRSSLLQSLTMRASKYFKDAAEWSDCFPMLKELNIGFSSGVSAAALELIVKNCPMIEVLNVEGCKEVDEKAVMVISNLKCLMYLNLSHCTFVTNEAITTVSQQCKLLNWLNIDGITRITDRAVCSIARNLHQTLIKLILDGEELTNISFFELQKCKFLVGLEVSYAESLTNRCLTYIKSFHHLVHLKLKRGPNLTAGALTTFFVGPEMQHLQHLELDSLALSDVGVEQLAKSCPKLHTLSLPWCWEITDVGLRAIVTNCSMLIHLDLLGLYKITGISLLKIPHCLPLLEYLNLEQCNQIYDPLLESLVKMMPSLRVLDYYGQLVQPSSDESDDASMISPKWLCDNCPEEMFPHRFPEDYQERL